DLPPRDYALGEIGTNAAVVHDRHIGPAGSTLRVGNQASQTIFVTLTLQWHLDPRHHPLSDVANGLLLAYERGGQRGVGCYLVRIRRHQLHAHFATSARAHKVHDADRPRARLDRKSTRLNSSH